MRSPQHTVAALRDAIRYLTAGSWRRALKGLGVVSVLGVLLVFLLMWAGFVSISASSGHWPVTGWVLHFTMRNAVRTQSLNIKVPPLDEPALVLKGAGHYENGCAPCHGAPDQPRSLIAMQMMPPPPFLPPKIRAWEDRELFWIVKNGIKFAGMPAWVAPKREDEVWAVVAFIRQLPDMPPERYAALARGPVATAGIERAGPGLNPDHLRPLSNPLGPVLQNCARCHGEDGLGRGEGAFPKLAGQSQAYLLASLAAYANGTRQSGIMQPIAAGLEQPVLEELARHYASLPVRASRQPAEPADAIGLPKPKKDKPEEAFIPHCQQCHGPKPGPRNPMYPELAGQYADYLALQLELFQSGIRGGSDYANIMHSVAQRLTNEQIRELAEYYAALQWGDKTEGLEEVVEHFKTANPSNARQP